MTAPTPLDRSTIAEIMRRWQSVATAHWSHIDPALLSSGGLLWQITHNILVVISGTTASNTALRATLSDADLHTTSSEQVAIQKALQKTLERSLQDTLLARATRLAALPISWPDQRRLLELLAATIRQTLTENAEANKISEKFTSKTTETSTDLSDHPAPSPRPSNQTATELKLQMALHLAHYESAIETLKVYVADLCIQRLQQQIDDQHERALATEHLAERFLGNASHDLRTPLTAIMGFADLLLEGTYGDLTPQQAKHIGDIENSAANLDEIISNMLDLLRIRGGKLILNYRPVVVTEMLRSIHQILTPLAVRKNVTFRLDVNQRDVNQRDVNQRDVNQRDVNQKLEELGVIEVDEGIVRHIVYYLLSSAIRATPSGGEVVLRGRREQHHLVIEAEDTALHLPPDAIANMLDPFPRLENSPVRGFEGWEVGLPLVRRYVEIHHGTLSLESLPDRGTVFYVSLPTKRPRSTEI